MRREWSGEIEGEIVPVGVFRAKVPHDALSGGQEAVLSNDDRRKAASGAHRDLFTALHKLERVDDGEHRRSELTD